MDFYATFGPSCEDLAILEAMTEAGMTGLRLNLAHADLPQVRGILSEFFNRQKQRKRPITFLVDLIGAKLRVGKLSEQQMLIEGEELHLVGEDTLADESHQRSEAQTLKKGGKSLKTDSRIPIPTRVFSILEVGDHINFDDKKLLVSVESVKEDEAKCRVLRGGPLRSGKTLKVEGKELALPPITRQDKAALEFLAEIPPNAIMIPFCEGREDVDEVRRTMVAMGLTKVKLFAKIETPRGVENIDAILPACDYAVIARGDLGNAYPLFEIPRLQKQLAKKCISAQRSLLIVTELLASMETKPIPTRAEVCDIYNAVLDGADALMLTGETAMGCYPVEAMRTLVQTASTGLA